MRCDLYNDSIRKLFLQDFSAYIDAWVAYYDAGSNDDRIKSTLGQTAAISGRIWKRAVLLSHDLDNRVRSLQMIPALNNKIDIVTIRESSRNSKVPPLIIYTLWMLTLVSAFLTGYNYKGKRRNMVMITSFALMTTLTIYLVLDLDRPRRGLINLDAAQANIVELKKLTVEDK